MRTDVPLSGFFGFLFPDFLSETGGGMILELISLICGWHAPDFWGRGPR